MATKSKKIYRKKEDRSLELVGYLPTEDVSSRVDSALAKKQDKLTPGKGISINTTTNEISVNDGAFATTDYVMNNFVANSIYEQDKDGLDHDIYGLASRVTANESSINNLNNAVADRYTKGETDGRYAFKNDIQDSIRQASYSPENLYDINPFLFNNLANLIERGGSAEVYNSAGNRIKSSNDMVSLFRFGSGTYTSIYINEIINGDDSVFDIIIKSPESYKYAGVLSVYFPTYYDDLILEANAYWGYSSGGTPTTWNSFYNKSGETALSHHGMYSWIQRNNADTRNWFKIHFKIERAYNEVRLGLISYVPYDGAMSYFLTRNGGTVYDKINGRITNADTADNATHANNADVADNFAYGRGVAVDANSVNENTSWVKAVFGDEGYGHFHITEVRTQDTGPKYIPGNYSAGIAWKGYDTYGALTVSYNFPNAYICGGNGTAPVWGRSIVLSENGSNIADQSVAYADRAGYANSSGTAAVCESTTLLTAEGENLGAKIRSQYTTGSLGGSVTYHQATWYVTGNDGDTYNFGKMITTDNFGTNLTEALKNTKVEYTIRSDYATHLDYRNDDRTSISISYDNDNGTSLKYTSYPKLFINGITGYGVLEGNVYNHGSFQLAVSDNSNGTIYVRSVAKDGSAPSWAKLLIDDDVINSLDSDIINRPLSAYQGKVMSGKITSINSNITSINSSISSINNKFLDYQPKLNSETGATMQWLSFKSGSSYSISGIWCGKVEMTIDGSVGTQANANFTVDTTYQSTFSSGSWYFVAMPCEGGYINTLSWGLETNSSNTGGTLYALRVYSGVRTKYKFNIIGIRLW